MGGDITVVPKNRAIKWMHTLASTLAVDERRPPQQKTLPLQIGLISVLHNSFYDNPVYCDIMINAVESFAYYQLKGFTAMHF